MQRVPCAIIGSGNIGTDLMMKLARSTVLEPTWMVGIDEHSDGLARARSLGLKTTHEGVQGLVRATRAGEIGFAFDATSAYAHAENSALLRARGVRMLDLTPAAIGPYCVPPVNLLDHLTEDCWNLNMVTCGGQATIPMVFAVSRVQSVRYAEIVATVSSRSAGPGTRKNIDEFTRTTAGAVARVGGAREGKAIIILNPADPPIIMRDTIHCLTDDVPDQAAITDSVNRIVADVQTYVPGYRLVNGPVFDSSQGLHRVSVFLEVAGLGDYLPKYAGNLDIMTAAATKTAEVMAGRLFPQGFSQ